MIRYVVGCFELHYRLGSILRPGRLAGMALLMMVLICQPASGVEIMEGTWEGSYQPAQSAPFNAEFTVEYSPGDGNKTLAISMELVDLEPKMDFTYEFEDIEIEENGISFRIRKANVEKLCHLDKQEDDSYQGPCQADNDPDQNHLTTIVMIPPSDNGKDKE